MSVKRFKSYGVIVLMLFSHSLSAQQRYDITVKDAVDIAFKNVADLKNAQLDYNITEARNKEDEEFGVQRLVRFVNERKEEPAKQLTESTISNIRENWLGTDQEDDWTLLVIKRGM